MAAPEQRSPGGSRRRLLLAPSLSAPAVPMLAGDVAVDGRQGRMPPQDQLPRQATALKRTAAANGLPSAEHALPAANSSPGLQRGGSSDSASLVGISGKDPVPGEPLYVSHRARAAMPLSCSLACFSLRIPAGPLADDGYSGHGHALRSESVRNDLSQRVFHTCACPCIGGRPPRRCK